MVLLAFVASSSQATIILELDLPQLVGRSDVIFVGKAIKTYSHWSEDKRHIVTDTTFQVSTAVSGVSQGKSVVIRRLGGAVGGIGMRVSGAPSFNKGDEVLLFTEKRGNGKRYVVGMKQGAFRITRDRTARQVVQTRLDGLALARRSPQGRLQMIERREAGPELLGHFVNRIRQTIALCAREKTRCRSRE